MPCAVQIYCRYCIQLSSWDICIRATWVTWQVVCCLPYGARPQREASQVHGAVVNATQEAPTYLLRRQTMDAIDSISRATGRNRRVCKAMLSAVLPDGTFPSFNEEKDEQAFLSNVTHFILCLDGEEEKELITDMRELNIRGNSKASKYELFREYCSRTLDLENGSGAHHRRHASADGDQDTTNNVLFAPGVLSIPQLIRLTVSMLEKDGKVMGEDFAVPSQSWVTLQMHPNNAYRTTGGNYSCTLPFVRKMITRNGRNTAHPVALWNSAMKKSWRHHCSHLVRLFEAQCEPRESVQDYTPCPEASAALVYAGADDKTTINVGKDIPLEATKRQSNCAIVNPGASVQAGDHDFTCSRLVPSVIHKFNLSKYPGDSLYSGGPDGTGQTFVAVHDATLEPSTGLKQAAHFLQFLRELKSDYKAKGHVPFDEAETQALAVLLECDGGPDHNLTFFSNQLALLGLFLAGDMDNLMATRGCPGLSYLLTAERAMPNLNLGISSLATQMDPNMPRFLKELQRGLTTMKDTRRALIDYDEVIKVAIAVLERRIARLDGAGNACVRARSTRAQPDIDSCEEDVDMVAP